MAMIKYLVGQWRDNWTLSEYFEFSSGFSKLWWLCAIFPWHCNCSTHMVVTLALPHMHDSHPYHWWGGWVTWPVKISSRNDLYCVEWDVKPYSTHWWGDPTYGGIISSAWSHNLTPLTVIDRLPWSIMFIVTMLLSNLNNRWWPIYEFIARITCNLSGRYW